MRIVALVAAYNEADVIGQVVDDLLSQAIEVHLIDNGSTDETARIAARSFGHGVLAVEQFPKEESASQCFPWAELLRRKEELAEEIRADWFLHQDADELRESPWVSHNLRQGLELVDALGYNAVDFEVLNFRPINDDFRSGADLRAAFRYYESAENWNRVQIKAWKKQAGVDLVSSGGHEAVFPGRRIFPVRFLCRHYPIRGQTHGKRKVFVERRPRFVAEELERGWHRQYDLFGARHSFIWRQEELLLFDPERLRIDLAIWNREWESAAGMPVARHAELLESIRNREDLASDLDRQNREVERLNIDLDHQNREVERFSVDLDHRNREVERLNVDLDHQNREVERFSVDLDHQNREVKRLNVNLDHQNREVKRLNVDLDHQNREVERLNVDLDHQSREVERLSIDLDHQNRERGRLEFELELRTVEFETVHAERAHLRGELERFLLSRTWRWSAPFRNAYWRFERFLWAGGLRRKSK